MTLFRFNDVVNTKNNQCVCNNFFLFNILAFVSTRIKRCHRNLPNKKLHIASIFLRYARFDFAIKFA